MRRRRTPDPESGDDIDGALGAMGAEDLRALVRDILPELDERAYGRAVASLTDRAARGGSGWAPAAPSKGAVAEVLAFIAAAARVGFADPSDIDRCLRRGTASFLQKDYNGARQIFGCILPAIAEGDIDLGQHEMADEVLGVDARDCAAQYVVSVYMDSEPTKRAAEVRAAFDTVRGVALFTEPLREMERVAVEVLPGFDTFLAEWQEIIEKEAGRKRSDDWSPESDGWLHEAVRRVEGVGGLARIARSTRRASDLRAWCRAHAEARDWKAALLAYEEAARLLPQEGHALGEFLDGAALAAQELGRADLSARLESAWRSDPTMLRLRCWLGRTGSKAALRKRAAAALKDCPKRAARERAFLNLVLGRFEPAAELLASAPGLGWSAREHPGHLVFALFQTLLGDETRCVLENAGGMLHGEMDFDEFVSATAGPDEPRLAVPEAGEILERAGIGPVAEAATRKVMLDGMRGAAEGRVAGVTGKQRRGHYGHAARLVAVCVALDPSPDAEQWMMRIKDEYRRYPAFRAQLDQHLRALRRQRG